MTKNTISNEELLASVAFQNIRLKIMLNSLSRLLISKEVLTEDELTIAYKDGIKSVDLKKELVTLLGISEEKASSILKENTNKE